jgi:hypothetical protein
MKRSEITSILLSANISGLAVLGIIGVFLGLASPLSSVYHMVERTPEPTTLQEVHAYAQDLVAQVHRIYTVNKHFAFIYSYGFLGLGLLFLVNIVFINTATRVQSSGFEQQMPGTGLGLVLVGMGLLYMMIQFPSTPAVSALARADNYQALQGSTDVEQLQKFVSTLSDRVRFTHVYSKIQVGIYGVFMGLVGAMIGRIVVFLHKVRQSQQKSSREYTEETGMQA